MKKNFRLFIFIMLTVVSFQINGQQTKLSKTLILPKYSKYTLDFSPDWYAKQGSKAKFDTPFSSKNLPFFCKIEHKIEKGSKIGFRFRLGDLNYVNMLENK